MLTDLQLIDIQARALYLHNTDSRLTRVNEPNGVGPDAPRFFFGRTLAGNISRFRADLPQPFVQVLDNTSAAEPISLPSHDKPRFFYEYLRLLEAHAPVRDIECGPAYYFPEYPGPSRPVTIVTERNVEILYGGFDGFVEELPEWQPFVAVTEGGRAVSVCRSVRISADVHEAGVETAPEYRGRGYAVDATAAWAHLVASTGVLPMYSTSWKNNASQAVARKLGLKMFGVDLSFY